MRKRGCFLGLTLILMLGLSLRADAGCVQRIRGLAMGTILTGAILVATNVAALLIMGAAASKTNAKTVDELDARGVLGVDQESRDKKFLFDAKTLAEIRNGKWPQEISIGKTTVLEPVKVNDESYVKKYAMYGIFTRQQLAEAHGTIQSDVLIGIGRESRIVSLPDASIQPVRDLYLQYPGADPTKFYLLDDGRIFAQPSDLYQFEQNGLDYIRTHATQEKFDQYKAHLTDLIPALKN